MIDLAYNLWLFISSSYSTTGLTLVLFSLILGLLNSRIASFFSSIAQNEIIRKSAYDSALTSIISSKNGLKEKRKTVELLRQRFKLSLYTDLAPVLPFVGQIPILLTAYYFLENNPLFYGVSFGMLEDLSKPDKLFLGFNMLPLLMTLLNILVALFDNRLNNKRKRSSFVIAAVFLVLLYNKSSALLLYWSISNLILLLKTLSRFNLSDTNSDLSLITLYAFLEGLVWVSKDTGMGLLEGAVIFCIVFIPFYFFNALLRLITHNNLLYSFVVIVFLFNARPIYSLFIQHSLILIGAAALTLFFAFKYLNLIRSFKIDKLNAFLTFLIAVLFLSIIHERWRSMDITQQTEKQNNVTLTQNSNSPNILHIVLDGYAGDYALSKVFEYDNTVFLDSLKSLGFQISRSNSQSNYSQTHLSLASMLNMTYLDSLVPKTGSDRFETYSLMRNSAAGKLLQDMGYLYYHFDSGWGGNKKSDIADFNRSGFSKIPSYLQLFFYKSAFSKIAFFRGRKAVGIINSLQNVDEILQSKGKQPHYILLHLMLPHPPYVFSADFQEIKNSNVLEHGDIWLNKQTYITAVKASNAMIFQFVKRKFMKSDPENLIIVINSDHGSHYSVSNGATDVESKQERMSNITFVYNSGINVDFVSSPVNLYRVLFNDLFNASYDTLPHKSFYSSYENPYEFEAIPLPQFNQFDDVN
jgi:hypothetical protein